MKLRKLMSEICMKYRDLSRPGVSVVVPARKFATFYDLKSLAFTQLIKYFNFLSRKNE